MFKRCLKYDLKSFRTVFLIASVAILLLCTGCGLVFGTFAVVPSPGEDTPLLQDAIFVITYFLTMLSTYALSFGISIYLGLIGVLRIIRYFTHFFTDQGYLTFTLPVPRKTLFRAKIVSHVLYAFWSYGILILGGGIMLSEITLFSLFSPAARAFLFMTLKSILLSPYFGFLLVLFVLILGVYVASFFAMMYFDYFIVTYAATMFRRLKVLSVIVTYYVVTNVLMVPLIYICIYGMMVPLLTSSMGFFVLFSVPWLGFSGIYLLLLIAILAMIVFSIIFRNLTLWRLERRVNLA